MPLPETTDVGKIMRKLNKEGGRSRKQKIAIALDVARKSGAKIPKKKRKRMAEGGYMIA